MRILIEEHQYQAENVEPKFKEITSKETENQDV